MVKKWSVPYPAVGGEEERDAYLYLPVGYEEEPQRRYPVLYMFDGQNVFWDEDATYGKSWGLEAFLDEHEVPLIVAALECNTGANNERLDEYSPYPFSDPGWGTFAGHGEDTMRWFAGVFKPWVDEHCRTLPDRAHTFIAGSSMGGRSRIAPDTVLYMDYGAGEMENHAGMRRSFGTFGAKLMGCGVNLAMRIVPDGDHSEASWERQLPFVLETLFYDLSDPNESDD